MKKKKQYCLVSRKRYSETLKRIYYKCFPVNFAKFLMRTFRCETTFGNRKPFEIDEKRFSFLLKISFCSEDI